MRRIEERLAIILRNAEGWLPKDQLDDMQSLVAAREPGVALENFWTQLEEYDVDVPDSVRHEIKQIAAEMEMRPPHWIERA
ncbi:hypothetical protein AKJ09_00999 [Labilithrix luteola]|uniref:Uncharacterized protein n=1 Tax=Labilithrix luteola TaxID=1391654 RepID=A0A0K1PLD3_9BACT|nr:hypothetical protein AKJ09_00999 [Labilithrix luteola]